MPRGEQIVSPTATGVTLDRGMIWQGFDVFNTNGGKFKITLPDHLALSMHDIYVQRISSGTVNGQTTTTFPSESDPLQAWSLGTFDTLVTTAHSIDVFRPGNNVADLSLISKVTEDENGHALNLYGRYTDQIAYSYDGTLAYIAGTNSNIYVFDTQTKSVVHTIHVVNSTTSLTSLAVVDGWLYVTEGSPYGGAYGATGTGRLVRINIDQFSGDFLNEQQVIQFGAIAPIGFQDMAVNNGSYLAITAPQSPDNLVGYSNGAKGNVYVLDLGKIDENGLATSVTTITAAMLQGKGKFTQYITSGQNDGEFLLSSGKDYNSGLISLKVGLTAEGNLDGSAHAELDTVKPISDPNWLQKPFQQNIQRAADTVIVTYKDPITGIDAEYALVADYNFVFLDTHWMNDMQGKQIGGKIGVIKDPFGKNGGPTYLGATTPIVGGAIDHLTLAADGKLYADVFVEDTSNNHDLMYKALFVWDAGRLIQDALDARTDNVPYTQPIDKVRTGLGSGVNHLDGNYAWRSAPPARYNGTPNAANAGAADPNDRIDFFGWTYGIGAYTVPGRMANLTTPSSNINEITSGTPVSSIDDNLLTRYLGITDSEMQAAIDAGDTHWYNAAWYAAKYSIYTGVNLLLAGSIDREAQLTEAYLNNRLDGTEYAIATTSTIGVSIMSLVGATRVASKVTGALAGSLGVFGSGLAGGLAGSGTYTIANEAGKITTYSVTDGQVGNSVKDVNYSQVTTDILIGSALFALPGVLGQIPWFNSKIVWNSPSLSNSMPFRLVEPVMATDTRGLAFSLANDSGINILKAAGGKISRGSHSLDIPARGSLSLEKAEEWMLKAGNEIDNFVDKTLRPQEQAWQAMEMSNAILMAGRNAMQDANVALRLNFTAAPKTFAQLKAEFGKTSSGDSLYDKIIAYAKEQVQKLACFVAGTLVHTKDGLRPIEEIKVGDYVLSKPENGEGELAYKRVTRTFVHENREVFGVTYGYAINKAALLVTTAEHPFWVPQLGVKDPNQKWGGMKVPHSKWVSPEEMFKTHDNYYKGKGESIYYYLSTYDGKEYPVGESTPICVTTKKKKRNRLYDYFGSDFGVLWPVTPDYQREAKGLGGDFRVSPPVILTNPNNEVMTYTTDLDKKSRNTDKASWVAGTTEHYTCGYQPKLCTVYNLEVEDYHTYFVGEHGIWVHNTCADLVNRLPEAKLPSEATNTYWETSGNIIKLREVYAYDATERDVITIVKDLSAKQKGYGTQATVLGKIIDEETGRLGAYTLARDELFAIIDRTVKQPFMKAGDMMVYLLDGEGTPYMTNLMGDVKGGIFGTKGEAMKRYLEAPYDPLVSVSKDIKDFVADLANLSLTLEKNYPSLNYVYLPDDQVGVELFEDFIAAVVKDPRLNLDGIVESLAGKDYNFGSVSKADWFSSKIVVAGRKALATPIDGATQTIDDFVSVATKKIEKVRIGWR